MTSTKLLRRAIIAGLTAVNLVLIPAAFIAPSGATTSSETSAAAKAAANYQGVAASGVVEPYGEARELAATTIGTIVYLGAEEGDKVKAGQILAELDNADLKAQLQGAEATVAMRKSELERLENGARAEDRREAAASAAEAEVAVRLAKTTLQRRLSLAQSGIASELSLDQARADADTAQARRELMAARVALVNAPPRPEDISIAEANLSLAEAAAKALDARIERTRIRSPVDGVLLRRYRALGEVVSVDPPTPIAVVGDISRLRVRAFVDEADVMHVAVAQPVSVTADALGDRRLSGKVARVGLQLGPKHIRSDSAAEKFDTKVLPVLIDLDEPAGLPVGLRVDVHFAPIETQTSQR